MSNRNAGLSLQDAWNEAAGEDEVPASDSTTPGSVEPVTEPSSEGEQPTVETSEKPGLFTGLDDEKKANVEQPTITYSTEVQFEDGTISIKELKAGYMRQSDYTQKTQELSEQRKEAEDALTLYRALQSDQATSVVQRLWNQVSKGQPIGDSAPAPRNSDTDIQTLIDQKVKEALASDPRIQAFEDQALVSQVNEVFAQIEEDWGLREPLSLDEKQFVLEKANEWGIPDIEATFAKLMHMRQKAEDQAHNVAQNSTAQGYGGEQSVGLQVPSKPERFAGFRDALNDTLKGEGLSETDLGVAIANL